MPSILDYRCVLALREARSFARASVAIGLSQPALTARIRRLEDALGLKLFDRGRYGARITPAGSAFAETAERIVALSSEAVLAAHGAAEGMGQTLRIGYTQIAARPTLLPMLKRFRTEHPLMRLRLRESTTVSLEAMLAQDQLDAAILHPPIHTEGLSELFLGATAIIQADLGPPTDNHRPPIEYPRSDAPVLIGEYNRKYPGDQVSPPAAEADTAVGAIVLSQAGYGSCVVAQSSWDQTAGTDGVPSTRLDMELHTSLAWRRSDRRQAVRSLVELCRSMDLD